MPDSEAADIATIASPIPSRAEPAGRPDPDERRDAEHQELLHDDRRRGRAHHRRLDRDRDAVDRAGVAEQPAVLARRAATASRPPSKRAAIRVARFGSPGSRHDGRVVAGLAGEVDRLGQDSMGRGRARAGRGSAGTGASM